MLSSPLKSEAAEETTAEGSPESLGSACHSVVLAAVEDERRRLAQRLHDNLCQSFSGIHLLVSVLTRKLEAVASPVVSEMDELGEMMRVGIVELHHLAQLLQPCAVEADGLWPAIENLARGTEGRVACQLQAPLPLQVASAEVATQLHALAREAVDRALYEAGATEVRVSLSAGAREVLELMIEDNGCAPARHHGEGPSSPLEMMRYRAHLLGASHAVESRAGGGTMVCCRLSPYLP